MTPRSSKTNYSGARIAHIFAGVVFFGIGLLSWSRADDNYETFPKWFSWFFLIFGVLYLAAILTVFLRRLMLAVSRPKHHPDGRPNILYLRTFADDGRFQLAAPRGKLPIAIYGLLDFEDTVARAADNFGPLIAIGRPGEILPHLGAVREYLEHDGWKGRVELLLKQCSTIVLVLGNADGFAWEVRKLIESGYWRKAVVIVPPLSNEEVHSRWTKFVNVAASVGFSTLPPRLPTDAVAFAFSAGGFPRFVLSELRGYRTMFVENESASQYTIAVTYLIDKVIRGPFSRLDGDFRITRSNKKSKDSDQSRPKDIEHAETYKFKPPSDEFEPPREWLGE